MKRGLHGWVCILISVGFGGAAFGDIIYVKNDASGENDGGSWTDAYTDLQVALANASATDEIWVCGGTTVSPRIYKPVPPPPASQDRTTSFSIPVGFKVFGGFAGTEGEEERHLRNEFTNLTILDGDIGTANVASDNSYHVVYFDDLSEGTTVLSGFTIRNGNADGTD